MMVLYIFPTALSNEFKILHRHIICKHLILYDIHIYMVIKSWNICVLFTVHWHQTLPLGQGLPALSCKHPWNFGARGIPGDGETCCCFFWSLQYVSLFDPELKGQIPKMQLEDWWKTGQCGTQTEDDWRRIPLKELFFRFCWNLLNSSTRESKEFERSQRWEETGNLQQRPYQILQPSLIWWVFILVGPAYLLINNPIVFDL